jgi:hypothetical protein
VPDEVSIAGRRSWNRFFSALRLVGAIRQAFDLRKLAIAALGLALLQSGWSLLDRVVSVAGDATPNVFESSAPTNSVSEKDLWSSVNLSHYHSRLSEPVRLLTAPLLALVEPGTSWRRMLHALVSVIWLLVVWGICGGAIARIAIVRFATMRTMKLIDAVRFALQSAGPLILAPLCPLIGLAFCSATGAAFGLIYRLPAVGPALAGALLIVPLAAGLVMTLLVAGLVAGWPLMHAAIAGGAEDSLDALSRIFGYVNQRLGPLAALVGLAWIEGMLGLAIVDLLTQGVIRLTHWSLDLTGPAAVTAVFFGPPAISSGAMAGATHGFWLGLVRLLAHAWVFSFFWTVAAYLYLWLRQDVDGQSMTEIEPDSTTTPALGWAGVGEEKAPHPGPPPQGGRGL